MSSTAWQLVRSINAQGMVQHSTKYVTEPPTRAFTCFLVCFIPKSLLFSSYVSYWTLGPTGCSSSQQPFSRANHTKEKMPKRTGWSPFTTTIQSSSRLLWAVQSLEQGCSLCLGCTLGCGTSSPWQLWKLYCCSYWLLRCL